MRRRTTLLQRFSVVTLITTVAMGAILASEVTSSIEQTAVESARNDLAEAVRTRNPFWLDMSDPKAEFARLHDGKADYDAWKKDTDTMLAGYAVYRIKIWNSKRQIIWSDDASLVGQ